METTIFFNKKLHSLSILLWIVINITVTKRKVDASKTLYVPHRKTTIKKVTKFCTNVENVLKARHHSCFLRPDTGPCRADIVQWYFDPKQSRCYRFYWGGCQGNGNRFESKQQCKDYCFLNSTNAKPHVPYFCSLTFEYGDCFGYFHRWGWDKLLKSCKRYVYSGCGGNQNNFQTNIECMHTCISPPNNTLQRAISHQTTCMPIFVSNLQ